MSHKLINHSSDLKKLQNEGFEIEIKNAHLLVHSVPYVNSNKNICRGTIVSKLDLAGDRTVQPKDHVVYFIGEQPCSNDGNIINGILNASQNQILAEGVEINHTFSAKPRNGGYKDYFEKITTYVSILSSQAEFIDPSVTAKTFKVIESSEPEIVFHYIDTNSSRAEIDITSSKLQELKVAIVGLGGTGSYVLDFVAKTWVKEIHLFDGDNFLQHNAFRSPGAISIENLKETPKKVNYFHGVYSEMRKNIIPREIHIDSSNLEELSSMDFVFICIDKGETKKIIMDKLTENKIPFIDVGIGVEIVDEKLRGSARITASTYQKNDHVSTRISFSDGRADDYSQNIQIAELNALNAALAVIKWKKLFGFYHDLEKEHNIIYNIDVNQLVNDENIS